MGVVAGEKVMHSTVATFTLQPCTCEPGFDRVKRWHMDATLTNSSRNLKLQRPARREGIGDVISSGCVPNEDVEGENDNEDWPAPRCHFREILSFHICKHSTLSCDRVSNGDVILPPHMVSNAQRRF